MFLFVDLKDFIILSLINYKAYNKLQHLVSIELKKKNSGFKNLKIVFKTNNAIYAIFILSKVQDICYLSFICFCFE